MGMTYCTLPSPRVIRGKTNAGGRARYERAHKHLTTQHTLNRGDDKTRHSNTTVHYLDEGDGGIKIG